MNQVSGLKIRGVGHYAPKHIITNDDLSQIVDTNDEWITTRTGIKTRHFVEEETNLDIASEAAKMAIENSGVSREDIDICVVATFTSDYKFPALACLLQSELGLREDIPCFDLSAACSGFIYGLQAVRGMLMAGEKKYGLIVGSETISKFLDMKDRSTCILFGDGAGAAVVEISDEKEFIALLGASGNKELLYCNNERETDQCLRMEGNQVFRFAVKKIPECIRDILNKGNLSIEDIDYIVCHQANMRIIEYVAKTMKQPLEKFYMNVSEYGNTSAASIPIALSEMSQKGMLKSGMKILCVGFGAGLTWGSVYLEW